ncbi:MAG: hypothetical protein GF416_01165 [Candidatus Altiarchaeales archaeon]|nr:hypothetical protein [Candidatus Altiarchaeales archaeon]MBD3415726.1 hypothetical protein [Candidatus Altiarchaeales archaeon]
MRAVCIADIHGDLEAVTRLRNSIADKDIRYAFLLGDFSKGFKDPAENRADITAILDTLSDYDVKAIPGNCDQRETTDILSERNANLHNTVLKLPDADIIGFGGSNPTPFNTPFEYSEEDIGKALEQLHSGVDEGSKVIVMSHFPPKDTRCDQISDGTHVGSTALREYIEEKQPNLVLCSHIHESGGSEDKIGDSRIFNLGRISEGRAYILEAGDAIEFGFYTG